MVKVNDVVLELSFRIKPHGTCTYVYFRISCLQNILY